MKYKVCFEHEDKEHKLNRELNYNDYETALANFTALVKTSDTVLGNFIIYLVSGDKHLYRFLKTL